MTFNVILCINYADTPREAENHELRTENTIVLIYIYTVMQHDLVKTREYRRIK